MPEMYQPPHSQSFSIWRNLLNIYIHVVITNINTGALGIDLVSRSTTATAEVVHQNTILTLIHYGIPRELQVPEMLPCNIYPQLWDVTVDSQAILHLKTLTGHIRIDEIAESKLMDEICLVFINKIRFIQLPEIAV